MAGKVATAAALALALCAAWMAGGSAPARAAAGDLDHSFSTDGRIVTDLDRGSKDYASTAAVDSRGRLLIAGSSIKAPEGARLAVARYLADGSLDPGFGAGGILISNAEGGIGAAEMAIDSGGRILLAGYGLVGDAPGAMLVRLLDDGSFDPSFGGGDGIEPLEVPIRPAELLLDPLGRPLLGGTVGEIERSALGVARLLPDGSLDAGFGGGAHILDLVPGAPESVAALLLDRFGAVSLVGGAWLPQPGISRNVARFALTRLQPDGTLDRSVRGQGYARIAMNRRGAYATAAALDSDRRAILAGPAPPRIGFTAVRGAGGLDPRFGRNGRAKLGVRDGYAPTALEIDGAGRPLAALAVGNPITERGGDMLGVRLRRDGRPDRSFSRDGRVSTGFGRFRAAARSLALYPDGRFVLAGISKLPHSSRADFAATRYLGD